MLERNAKKFRNIFLVLSLVVFGLGVLTVIMLGFDVSLNTGIRARMRLQPETFLGGATFLVLVSIAFGTIHVKN